MASPKHLLYPSLPPELIEEILYKTPVTSLIRFKSTCKKWQDLITSKRFIYRHLDQSPERFLRSDNHERLHIVDPVTGILSDSPIPEEFSYPTPIHTMLHCDGIMLCLCYDLRLNRKRSANLAVWNPAMKKIKSIEPSVDCRISDFYGFGYDNTSPSLRVNYKILRFLGPRRVRKDYDLDPDCEIYDFKSGSWRVLKTKFDWEWDIFTEFRGVSVKGNMYWNAGRYEEFILSFDFAMETFKHICVCPPVWYRRHLACFNGDRLSLLTQDKEDGTTEVEVWLTNKLSDEVVSFTKYFNVNTPRLPVFQLHTDMARPGYSIGTKHNGNIMAWCDGDVEEDGIWYTRTTLYNIDQGGIRRQIETGRHEFSVYEDQFLCSYSYVPSLVPVPEKALFPVFKALFFGFFSFHVCLLISSTM